MFEQYGEMAALVEFDTHSKETNIATDLKLWAMGNHKLSFQDVWSFFEATNAILQRKDILPWMIEDIGESHNLLQLSVASKEQQDWNRQI